MAILASKKCPYLHKYSLIPIMRRPFFTLLIYPRSMLLTALNAFFLFSVSVEYYKIPVLLKKAGQCVRGIRRLTVETWLSVYAPPILLILLINSYYLD